MKARRIRTRYVGIDWIGVAAVAVMTASAVIMVTALSWAAIWLSRVG